MCLHILCDAKVVFIQLICIYDMFLIRIVDNCYSSNIILNGGLCSENGTCWERGEAEWKREFEEAAVLLSKFINLVLVDWYCFYFVLFV